MSIRKLTDDVLHSQGTVYQLLRYGFVGGVAFVADYGLLWVLTEKGGVQYLVSAALAFVAGLTVNYLLSNLIVFKSHRLESRLAEFAVFAVIGVIGLGLNEGIMYFCSEVLGIYYMVSKLVSTVTVFFWNFFARKIALFSKKQ